MNDKKARHTVWLTGDAWDKVAAHYRADNCSTKNEYIEKAIRFYSGYLDADNDASYLPRVLSEVLEGKLDAFGSRLRALLFKLVVNDGMLTYITAANTGLDQAALDRLRVQCVDDAKRTHGVLELKDARASLNED